MEASSYSRPGCCNTEKRTPAASSQYLNHYTDYAVPSPTGFTTDYLKVRFTTQFTAATRTYGHVAPKFHVQH